MMNCELRANVAGFTSDTVDLFNRRIADNPDIGTHRPPSHRGRRRIVHQRDVDDGSQSREESL